MGDRLSRDIAFDIEAGCEKEYAVERPRMDLLCIKRKTQKSLGKKKKKKIMKKNIITQSDNSVKMRRRLNETNREENALVLLETGIEL